MILLLQFLSALSACDSVGEYIKNRVQNFEKGIQGSTEIFSEKFLTATKESLKKMNEKFDNLQIF